MTKYPVIAIDALAFGGDGVGRCDGKVTFVPFSAPGDRMEIEVTQRCKRYDRARCRSLVEESSARREPFCPLFERCGGCQWQQIDYEQQALQKDLILRQTLQSRIEVGAWESFRPAPAEKGYRRRTRLAWRVKQGGEVVLGYRAAGSHELVDIPCCPLLTPGLQCAMGQARERLSTVEEGEGSLTLLEGRRSEVHFALRIERASRPLNLATWVDASPVVGGELSGHGSPRSHGAPHLVLEEGIGPELRGAAAAFAQANAAQANVLRRIVIDWAEADGCRIVDLYAGVGNFSVPLAAQARSVIASENAPVAARLLRRNAGQVEGNRIRVVADKSETLCRALVKGHASCDVMVLDPPRIGAKEIVDAVGTLAPQRVIYVSCDPMTLARDLVRLVGHRYRVVRAVGLDMMPQTFHIEAVVLLEHK